MIYMRQNDSNGFISFITLKRIDYKIKVTIISMKLIKGFDVN
ncbi:hypothetical protein [Staphylococcus pseudoxylosus]|nr:hypothetical protein [Staphylococcus pseudoxylosus]